MTAENVREGQSDENESVLLLLEQLHYERCEQTIKELQEKIDEVEHELSKAIVIFWYDVDYAKKVRDFEKKIQGIMQDYENDTRKSLLALLGHVGTTTRDEMLGILSTKTDVVKATQQWHSDGGSWKDSLNRLFKTNTHDLLSEIRIFDKLKEEVEKVLGSLKKRLKRMMVRIKTIVRTETTYIRSIQMYEQMKKANVKEFRFKAVLDDRTTDICRSMNGKVFKMSDFRVGVTVPPLHVNCRSIITFATKSK